jgi:hypothetical protein
MKKTATTLLAIGSLAALLATQASAASLLSETFTYPNGNLTPNGGWAIHSGSGIDIQVASGAAAGDMAQGPDDNRTFAAQSGVKVYYCFTATIADPGGSPSANYFIHLKDSGTSNFAARVFVVPQGATYSFGLAVAQATFQVQWPTALAYGQPYQVVVMYDPTTPAPTAKLWVAPNAEADPSIICTGGSAQSISSIALRQSNTVTPAGSKIWKYTVDDIGVGLSFSDACIAGPTPTRGATWGSIKTIYR